ncbi:phage prohead protease, HK97 family [Cooperia oncophora]
MNPRPGGDVYLTPMNMTTSPSAGDDNGYGSVFGVKDSHDDVVVPGAFTTTLQKWSEKKALPALLWQHRMDEPIGVYTEMKEDDVGLYVRGRLLVDDDPLAKRAHAHMKAGSLTGLSIGYILKDWEYDREKGVFLLKEIDLWEVAQDLQQKFDDFKAKNDKRIDAIEQEKSKLAEQVESLNGQISELENLKSDLEAELAEVKRPAGGTKNKVAGEHKEAFIGFMRKGREDGLRELERKALQVGNDEDGGYAIPEELDRTILTLLKDEVVMRQEATVITLGGSDYKKLVNLGGTKSGWVGETDTRPETATSKLGLIEPFMGEIYGNPQATQKMLDDAFFNVEDWINSELALEFAEQEEIAFTSGDGSKKPKGFLAYESTDEDDKTRKFGKLQHIASGAASGVTADAIIKLIYTLRKAHRSGAKFMMNNSSLFAIRLLKDNDGNYLWRPGIELGQPSSLAGYGIVENEQMPDIAADAKAIAFGNFKRGYTIVDRIGTRILRDPYTNKPFVGFYTTKRTGGMLVDSQAIKLMKIGAATSKKAAA